MAPSITEKVPLMGADGYFALINQTENVGALQGLHPYRVRHLLDRYGSLIGDVLALTKPLGTGVITTAAKADQADALHVRAAVDWTKRLNGKVAQIAVELGCKAGTDITGFGLLGHASEMVQGAAVGYRLFADKVPVMDGARRYAEQGRFPGGANANREAFQAQVQFDGDVSEPDRMLLFDPQTSGGLLIACSAEAESAVLSLLPNAHVIGAFTAGPPRVRVSPR